MKKRKKGKKTLRPRYGILIEGPEKGIEKLVTQYLRLVVADAPDAVRITAIEAVRASTSRPVSINNCQFEMK